MRISGRSPIKGPCDRRSTERAADWPERFYASVVPSWNLTSREAVLSAIAEFDEIGRDAFFEKYHYGSALSYFVIHGGRRYDSKAIFGVAYGYQTGNFLTRMEHSGGEATVAKQLRKLGFEVTSPVRLPDWTKDELILALDLYMKTRGQLGYSKTTKEVLALSNELRALHLFPQNIREQERFRDPAGVARMLSNFASIDREHAGAGMEHGEDLDRVVWEAWARRPEELAEVAARIRAANASAEDGDPEDEAAAETETGEDEEYEAEEGRLLYRSHRRRERDRKIVDRKKEAVLKASGRSACEVCDFESREVYGDDVGAVIDVHHIVPLHKLGQTTTRLVDLALVCPTCHRVIHAHKPFITPAELRAKRTKLRELSVLPSASPSS